MMQTENQVKKQLEKRPKKQVKISDIVIPKYLPLFNDKKHKHIILTSGRSGTKSSYAGIRTIYQITADPKGSAVVLRKHHNKLRKTVYKEMLRGTNRLQIPKNRFYITKSPMEITYKKYNTTIYFAGSDGIDDTKGIIDEDKPIKLVIIDEATEFFDDGEGEAELANIEATFVRGNVDNDFQMIYLFNPPKNPNAPIMAWLKKMEQRPDTIHIHTTYQDVPETWLGKALIESAEAMRSVDPKMYKWVWGGECVGVDELIYYMFNQQIHVEDDLPEEEKKAIGEIGIGIDYGQKNPTTFEAFGIDYRHQCLRGLDEYYHSGRESGQKSPSEYAADFKSFCENLEREYNRKISWIFIDPSAKGLAEEIKRQMPDISVKDADNTVKLGISRVQKLLSFGCLKLSRKQPWLIKEMGLYQYDEKSIEKGKEEVLKINDHCQDGTRYAVMGMWKKIKYFLPVAVRDDKGGDEP